MQLCDEKERLKIVWGNAVIAIDKRDVFAAHNLESGIAGFGWSLVRLSNELEACVRRGVTGSDSGSAVGRSVIDNDSFKIRKSLCNETVEAILDECLGVVQRDDDAYGWHYLPSPSFVMP